MYESGGKKTRQMRETKETREYRERQRSCLAAREESDREGAVEFILGRISILIDHSTFISSVRPSEVQPRELASLQLSTCSWFLHRQNLHIS
jgi:hypothetical protein